MGWDLFVDVWQESVVVRIKDTLLVRKGVGLGGGLVGDGLEV